MKEADIVVSGTTLTEAQSMTVRIALQTFAIILQGGQQDQLKKNYLQRIAEINELLHKTCE